MAVEVGSAPMVMPVTREAQAIPAHLIIILTIARDPPPQVREAVRERRPVPIRLQAPDHLVQVLQASVLPPQIQLRRRIQARHPVQALVRRLLRYSRPLHHIQIVELRVQNRKFLFKLISGRPSGLPDLFSRRMPASRGCSILLSVQSEAILSKKPSDPDLRFPYGQDPNQFADIRVPTGKGPHPVVFFIHGGYWRAKYDLTYAGHLCDALKKLGIATWNVEYRRVGNPGGGWPGTFEDIRSAYHALLEHKNDSVSKLDLKRLCVAGHSAGGHLAVCLAAFESSVTRVFSLAGVLDLRRAWELHLSSDAAAAFLGGTPSEVPDHYREASPAERAIPHATQKLIHGTTDDSVPYEISKNYADKKKKAGEHVELITLPDIGHFEIVDPGSAVWKQVENAFISLTRS
ncbi:MAG TPA: alpha/beta hydrolase [Verrucomicrobiae bacterium]|nr:alpha/beta hydrolase [Verrucomicrobiae bacterium]